MGKKKNETSKSKDFDGAQKSKISDIIKDTRGMTNENLEKRAGTRRDFLARAARAIGITAVIAALGLGSGCKAVEEDYQRVGMHGVTEKPNKATYEIYEKNGKSCYRGEVVHYGKREVYDGEIYKGEIIKREIEGVGKREVVKLRNGEDFVVVPTTKFIGETPDGSIILLVDSDTKKPHPIIFSRGKHQGKGQDEFMKAIRAGMQEIGSKKK